MKTITITPQGTPDNQRINPHNPHNQRLHDLLYWVCRARAVKDDARSFMELLHVEVDDELGAATFVATNGRRVHYATVPAEDLPFSEPSENWRVRKVSQREIILERSDNGIPFPNWRRVTPDQRNLVDAPRCDGNKQTILEFETPFSKNVRASAAMARYAGYVSRWSEGKREAALDVTQLVDLYVRGMEKWRMYVNPDNPHTSPVVFACESVPLPYEARAVIMPINMP